MGEAVITVRSPDGEEWRSDTFICVAVTGDNLTVVLQPGTVDMLGQMLYRLGMTVRGNLERQGMVEAAIAMLAGMATGMAVKPVALPFSTS